MKVNRFTNIRPAQYNPMALEELMMVPMMKRKQHDELLNNVATTQAALAQTDYMDMHEEKVLNLKKQLEADLQAQVDQVASEGISNTLRTNFTNLNAKYQQAMGPKGMFGKAANAKAEAAKNREEFIANSIQMGNDPVESGKRFDEAFEAYRQGQIAADDITNMAQQLPTKYEDLDADLLRAKQMMGHTVKTAKGDEGFEIKVDKPSGVLYAVTESGNIITKDNEDALGQQLAKLSNKWLKEGGDGYKSAMFNGKNIEDVAVQLSTGLSSTRINEVNDSTNKNYQFLNSGKAGEEEGEEVDPNANIYLDRQEIAETPFSSRSVAESRELLKTLRQSTDPDDIMLARDLDFHIAKVEKELEANDTYQTLKKERDGLIKNMDPTEAAMALYPRFEQLRPVHSKNPNETIYADPDNPSIQFKLSAEHRDMKAHVKQKFNGVRDVDARVKELEDDIAATHTIQYDGYQIDKRATTETEWKQFTGQIAGAIADSGVQNNKFKVDSYVNGVEREFAGNDELETQRELFRIFGNHVRNGGVNLERTYATSEGGEPMLEFSFVVKESEEINDAKIWDKEVEEGTVVRLRVDMASMDSDKAGTSDIQELYLNGLGQYGGAKGKELASNMRNNIKYKHIVASGDPYDFSQSADIKKTATFFQQKNPDGKVNLVRDVETDAFKYYVTNYTLDDGKSAPKKIKSGDLRWGHIINDRVLSDVEELSSLPPMLLGKFNADVVKYNKQGFTEEHLLRLDDAELLKVYSDFIQFYGEQPIQFESKESALATFEK